MSKKNTQAAMPVKSGHPVLRFLVKMAWRFFTGAHMTGQVYTDATWHHDARSYRHPHNTWWKRKARKKRAGWRNAIFWPLAFITWGAIYHPWYTVIILCVSSPAIILYLKRLIRLELKKPLKVFNKNGDASQHYITHPKVSKHFKKKVRPGVAIDPVPEDIPEEDIREYRVEVIPPVPEGKE